MVENGGNGGKWLQFCNFAILENHVKYGEMAGNGGEMMEHGWKFAGTRGKWWHIHVKSLKHDDGGWWVPEALILKKFRI